jgi:hypothetical protein
MRNRTLLRCLPLPLTLGLLALAATAPAEARALRAHDCRDVVVQFEPEGSGGATAIKAKRIRCGKARGVLRHCIAGELKPGWSGEFADPRFLLRKGRMRISYLPVGGGGCIPIPMAAGGSEPAPPPGADRVERYKVDLRPADGKERVLVYNKPKQGFPATWFEIWRKADGEWVRGQRKLVGQIPSYEDAGLVKAWVADLNGDGRVEIAVRDFITPSVGESLSILRQTSSASLRFGPLQSVGGDQVGVRLRNGRTALLEIFRKSNHSPDGVEHHEIWKWSGGGGAWRCTSDCAPVQ